MLQASDIYNFYALSYINSMTTERSVKSQLMFYLRPLKEKWLKVFKKLLYNQIAKYVARGRVDDFVKMEFNKLSLETVSANNLERLMKATWRSDMQRRNTNWNRIAEWTSQLETTDKCDDICFLIDRLNNEVHNADENILYKLDNRFELLQALNQASSSRTPMNFLHELSFEIRQTLIKFNRDNAYAGQFENALQLNFEKWLQFN